MAASVLNYPSSESITKEPLEIKARRFSGPRRWLIPPVPDLFFLVTLVSLCSKKMAGRLLDDGGIGWHIRNGEQILASHSIPHGDSFSASMPGHQWYAWEWFYDIGIALIHQFSGLNGVVFFTAIVIAATFALTLKFALAREASLPVAVPLVALAIAAASVHFLARPHVLSWLLGLICFVLLDQSSHGGQRQLYWLPVIVLFWVNLHGGFLLAFVLLAIYVVEEIWTGFASRDAEQRKLSMARCRRLSVAGGLSFLASFVNPYGWRLYEHLYAYLTDHFLMDHISEFRSPDFHGFAQRCFGLLVLSALAAFAMKPAKIRPAHLLLAVFAVYSGLYSARNLPLSSIFLVLIVAPLLTVELAELAVAPRVQPWLRSAATRIQSFAERMYNTERSLHGHVWPVAAVCLGIWICVNHGRLGSRDLINAKFDPARFPIVAVDRLKERNVSGPIFSPDYWGGYLIYRLYPANQVVVDDRHDMYGPDFFREYLNTIHVTPGWDKLLDEQHVRSILVPATSPLANILRTTPSWRETYTDSTSAFFQHD